MSECQKYTEAELIALSQHLEAVHDFYANKPLDTSLNWLDPDELEWALEDVNDLLKAEYGR